MGDTEKQKLPEREKRRSELRPHSPGPLHSMRAFLINSGCLLSTTRHQHRFPSSFLGEQMNNKINTRNVKLSRLKLKS
jgi:hypothetical protein